MECLNEHCPVPQPKFGHCEDCALELLESEGFSFAESLKILKIVFGE